MKEDQIKWNYNFNYHYKKKIYLLQVLLKNAYLDYMIKLFVKEKTFENERADYHDKLLFLKDRVVKYYLLIII